MSGVRVRGRERVMFKHHESSAAFPERGLKKLKRKKNCAFSKRDVLAIHENLKFM